MLCYWKGNRRPGSKYRMETYYQVYDSFVMAKCMHTKISSRLELILVRKIPGYHHYFP